LHRWAVPLTGDRADAKLEKLNADIIKKRAVMMRENFEIDGVKDVVLDTDAYNEIDDQFAISYLLRSSERLNTLAFYAAPFFNEKSSGPKDGMEKSYDEILKLLRLAGESYPVFKGSERYLEDEETPVHSPAAEDLAARAMQYTPERPLYVVAIGAITNVASALLLNPQIKERIVVVWLGGHSYDYGKPYDFNMKQDVAAVRVVMGSGVRFVQIPGFGVAGGFTISKPELEYWLAGKNPLADYLAKNTIAEADSYAAGKPWTRIIWDVTAIAWLLNDNDRFLKWRVIPVLLPEYENRYADAPLAHSFCCAYWLNRDALMQDLITKLTQ